MRILNVNMYMDHVHGGGTAERTFQMSRFLTDSAHQCHILTLDLGISPDVLEKETTSHVTALPCIIKRFYLPRFSYWAIKDIVGRSDIIHLMGHWTFMNALIYYFARLLKKPYVICAAGALPIFGRSSFIKHVYNALVGRAIVRGANRCIAVTELEREQFLIYGVDAKRISVIPNGIDIASVPVKVNGAGERLGLPKKPFLLFLGRLNPIKGPDLLLQAYAQLPDTPYDLVFVGPDGGLSRTLQAQTVRYRLADRVHFLGPLRGTDKYQAYYAASALVIPSRKEAMSIVALEAGATGIPLLLTSECGFDDVEKCGGGFIVPPTVDGLKNGLMSLIAQESELEKMGHALKKHIIDNYSWESLANVYKNLYDEILSQHPI
jgi:glycosyltransferase involved in cell wall biosynthesis